MPTITPFNCYIDQTSTETAIARPWPKCGISKAPASIPCEVSFNGTVPGICALSNGTYSLAFTKNDLCASIYFNSNVPVGIYWIGGFIANRYDTGFPVLGWSTGIVTEYANGGYCAYNKQSNAWEFNAGFRGHIDVGSERCTITINLKMSGV